MSETMSGVEWLAGVASELEKRSRLGGVRFRRLPHGEGLDVPRYESDGAAGMDLRSATSELLEPGDRARIQTGFEIAIPNGFEGQVRPRSGLALGAGVTVLNAPVARCVVTLVDDLDPTERGAGGFGSTGI